MNLVKAGLVRLQAAVTRKALNDPGESSELIPVLLSGSGRTGSTALMSLLASDNRVAFDQEYPFESRYLTYFVKFSGFLTSPEYFPFIDGEQLFDANSLGVTVARRLHYQPQCAPEAYVPRFAECEWVRILWKTFSAGVLQGSPNSRFYAEKVPLWLAAIVRRFMECYVIHNLRDPRDIFLSANAFMRKQKVIGFGRCAADTDLQYARSIALSFVSAYEKYFADRKRSDSVLVRYEDLVEKPELVKERLQQMAGLRVQQAASIDFERHRTAQDLASTVRRWQREDMAPEISNFFQDHLRDELKWLGYEVTLPSATFKRTIAFSRNGTEMSSIFHSSHGSLRQREDDAVLEINGSDFWIMLPTQPFEAKTIKAVWVCVRGAIGGIFSLYWRAQHVDFAETRSLHLGYSSVADWWVLSFPVHQHPEWKGTIHQLRLDLFNAPNSRQDSRSRHQGTGYLRWVRFVS